MSAAPATTIARPYTSYNLFFQLEREYILQILLGFRPTITPENIFDPTNNENYHGPPLPSRYADLILPYDWHIPGKTRRRKRVHRKSHGKIGFHELNERISKAWSAANGETRGYCALLADIQSREHNDIMKQRRMEKGEKKTAKVRPTNKCKTDKAKTTSEEESNHDDHDERAASSSFDWTASLLQVDFATAAARDHGMPQPKISRVVSRESVHRPFVEDAPQKAATGISIIGKTTITEVDIRDDEIIEMWKKTAALADEEDGGTTSASVLLACQVCAEEEVVPEESATTGNNAAASTTRMSFIDAEYDKFKEIGKHFSISKKQRFLPFVAAVEKRVFVARQA